MKLFADGFHLVRSPTQIDQSAKAIINKQIKKFELKEREVTRAAPLIQIDASGSSFQGDPSSPGKNSSYFPASSDSWRGQQIVRQSSRILKTSMASPTKGSPIISHFTRRNTSGQQLSRFTQVEALSPGLTSLNSISSQDSVESRSSEEQRLGFADDSYTLKRGRTKRYKRRLSKMNESFNFSEIDKHLFRSHHEYVRFILDKEPGDRSPEEVQEVVKVLENIKFFKERNISNADLVELAGLFKVATIDDGEEAVTYGDKGDAFYIILVGKVEVLVPNNKIDGWRNERFRFLQEQKWKEDLDARYKRLLEEDLQSQIKRNSIMRQASMMKDKIRQSIMKSHDFFRKDSFTSSVFSRDENTEESPMVSQDDEDSMRSSSKISPPLKQKNSLRLPKGEQFSFLKHSATMMGSRQGSKPKLSSNGLGSSFQQPTPDLFTRLALNKDEVKRYNRISRAEKKGPKWFIPAVQLGPGSSFGEIALLNNSARTATVKCLEECVFAVIDRANYEKVLGSIEQRNQLRKLQFFSELVFLRNVSKNKILKIIHSFYERKVKKHEVIIRQGDPADAIYIIKEGEFEMTSSVRVKCSALKPSKKKEDDRSLFRRIKDQQMKPVFTLPEKCSKQRFQLKKLCIGQLVGEIDVMLNRPYSTTVTCSSVKGVLYSIPKNEFFNKFSQEDALWNNLQDGIANQDNTLLKLIKAAVRTKSLKVNEAGPSHKQTQPKKNSIRKPTAVISSLKVEAAELASLRSSAKKSSPLRVGEAPHRTEVDLNCVSYGLDYEESEDNRQMILGPQPPYSKTEATSRAESPTKRPSTAGVIVKSKHVKYLEILKENQMRMTQDRLDDFRHAMMEIVDVKNGVAESDYTQNQSVIDRSSYQSVLNLAALKQPKASGRKSRQSSVKQNRSSGSSCDKAKSFTHPSRNLSTSKRRQLATSTSPNRSEEQYNQSVTYFTNPTQSSIRPAYLTTAKQNYVQSATDFTREVSTHNDLSPTTAARHQAYRNLPTFENLETEVFSRNVEVRANTAHLSMDYQSRKALKSQQQSRQRPEMRMFTSTQMIPTMTGGAATRNPSRTNFHSRGQPSPRLCSQQNLQPGAESLRTSFYKRPKSKIESSSSCFGSFFGDAIAVPARGRYRAPELPQYLQVDQYQVGEPRQELLSHNPTMRAPSETRQAETKPQKTPTKPKERTTSKVTASQAMKQKIELLKKIQRGKAIGHQPKKEVRRSVAATWLSSKKK